MIYGMRQLYYVYLREADHAQSTGGVCHLTIESMALGRVILKKSFFYRGDVTVYMYMCRFNYMYVITTLCVPT